MAVIYIPKTAPEIFESSKRIIFKHNSIAQNSPLNHIEITSLCSRITDLETKYSEYQILSEKCARLKEEFQKELGIHKDQKSFVPGTVRFNIVQVRDILKGIAREDISSLKNWGFKIIDSSENEYGK